MLFGVGSLQPQTVAAWQVGREDEVCRAMVPLATSPARRSMIVPASRPGIREPSLAGIQIPYSFGKGWEFKIPQHLPHST